MPKRLLALLVFIPMFLIAWYARNPRQQTSSSEPARTSERESRRPHETSGSYSNDARSNDRTDEDRSPNDRRRPRSTTDQPGNFDFYLLNLSWSPEFCATHPGKPECTAHPRFVLHGLWPQNTGGGYPEHCSNAPGPANPSAFADIFPDAGLLEHEWSTHGTCSGLDPETYFSRARTAVHAVVIPPTLDTLDHEIALAPSAILSQFAAANPALPRESLALSCGNNTLTAVEVCLDKSLHAIACSGIRSCRANSVRITPP